MPRRSRLFLFPTLKGSSLIVFKRAFLLYFICSENTRQEIWIIRCKYRVRQVTAVSRKKKAARKWTYRENPMQIKICQRSAPVWLMSTAALMCSKPPRFSQAREKGCCTTAFFLCRRPAEFDYLVWALIAILYLAYGLVISKGFVCYGTWNKQHNDCSKCDTQCRG